MCTWNMRKDFVTDSVVGNLFYCREVVLAWQLHIKLKNLWPMYNYYNVMYNNNIVCVLFVTRSDVHVHVCVPCVYHLRRVKYLYGSGPVWELDRRGNQPRISCDLGYEVSATHKEMATHWTWKTYGTSGYKLISTSIPALSPIPLSYA